MNNTLACFTAPCRPGSDCSFKNRSYCFLFIALLLASCVGSNTSNVMKQLDRANAERLAGKYGNPTDLGNAIDAANQDDTGRTRNILLNDLILLVDLNYYRWEKLVYDKKATFDLGTDAALLGLGGATALGGSVALTNILGQLTTGITGFKTSVDTDLLQKNAIPALVAKMRAARSTQLLKMQAAMIHTTSEGAPTGPTSLQRYTVEQGLIDLGAYYAAGTFTTALQDITAKASEEKSAADQKTTELKPNASLANPTTLPKNNQ